MDENPNYELREQPGSEKAHERPEPEFPPQKIVLPVKRRDATFYAALALAAFCILGAFSVGSFFAGFFTGSSMTTVRSASRQVGVTYIAPTNKQPIIFADRSGKYLVMTPQKGSQQIMVKVAVLPARNGIQFSQSLLKLPSGGGLTLVNQTKQNQVLTSNISGSTHMVLAPNVARVVYLAGPATFILRSATNPQAVLTVYVGG